MANDSPAAIIYDINGNDIGTILDGSIYRLQVESKISSGSQIGIDSSNTGGLALDSTLLAQSIVDNSSFTDGTSRIVPAGFIFDEAAGIALTENDGAAARVDNKRAQIVVIEDSITRGQRLTITASNAIKVDGSSVTQPVSGTVTANQGSPNTLLNAWSVKVTDGTNTLPTGDVAARAIFQKITDGIDVVEIKTTHPLTTDAGIITRNIESTNPTFYAVFDRIAPAANKYMATLFNTSSTRKIIIQRIWVYNWQITSVTGNFVEQYLARITSRTVGTTTNIYSEDTDDILSSGIEADTNSSAVSENHILRRFISSNENADSALGQLQGSAAVGSDVYSLIIERKEGTRGHCLRQNQGITIRNITNTTVGTISYVIEFTDEGI